MRRAGATDENPRIEAILMPMLIRRERSPVAEKFNRHEPFNGPFCV